MTVVTDSQGTKLLRSGVEIPQIKSIGVIGFGRTLRDTTSLGDTIHKHKMNIPDIPEIAVEVWYDPQEPLHQLTMRDEVSGAGVEATWTIQMEQGDSPNEEVALGLCWVFGNEIGPFEVDGDIVLKFNLKPQAFPSGLYE